VRFVACAGLGFLLAVLWFDLMFDVQLVGCEGAVPVSVRDSIAAYYRRVTTTARPMTWLVATVMLITVAVLVAEVVTGDVTRWVAVATLVLQAAVAR